MGRRVLVVEDDADIRQVLHEELTERGFELLEAETHEAALAGLKAGWRPDVMLVDYLMPGGTGQQLLEACRADTKLAGIPAVTMSALRPRDVDMGGGNAHLQKPFNVDDLVAALEAALAETGL